MSTDQLSNAEDFDAVLDDLLNEPTPEVYDGQHRTSVAGIFGLKDRPVPKTPHAIEQFDFDQDIYQDIYEQSTAMQETVEAGSQLIKSFENLSQDLFLSLYKHQPRLKGYDEVDEMSHFNRDLVGELMETDEYHKLRMNTRHDVLSSAIGSEVMQQESIQRIEAIRQQMNEKSQQDQSGQTMSGDQFFDLLNQMYDASQQAQQAQQQLDGLQGQQGQGQGPAQSGSGQTSNQGGGMSLTPEQAKALAQAAQQQQQQAQQQLQQAQQQLQQAQANGQNPMQQMHQAIQAAAGVANDEVNEMQDFLNAWGMDEGDKNRRITYEDKKRALSRLRDSNKLKKLTDLIGRFRQLARDDVKRKSRDGATAVKSVKTGNKLENVLPSELMQLAHPITRTNFKRKFSEKQLLEYEKDSHKTQGRGPIVVCCDTSGSMDGKAEEWSKALSLAILEIAQKQKRAYAFISFDSRVQDVYEIPFGGLKPDTVFDIAERFSGGGTNFERPLEEAMRVMKGQKFKKGDILFITDGSAGISDDFMRKFKQAKIDKEFSVKSVVINVGAWGSDGIVKEFSDEVLTLSSLADLDEKSALQIFQDVAADPQNTPNAQP